MSPDAHDLCKTSLTAQLQSPSVKTFNQPLTSKFLECRANLGSIPTHRAGAIRPRVPAPPHGPM
eukprot:3205381-Rhodomonas_salina.1